MCVCPYKLFPGIPWKTANQKSFMHARGSGIGNAPAMAENEKLLRQFRVFSVQIPLAEARV